MCHKIIKFFFYVCASLLIHIPLQAQTTTYGDTIFFENFGEHFNRVPCQYMPSGSYTFATEGGDKNQREIQDNYYAVVDPQHIKDGTISGDSFFWTAPSLSAVTTTGPTRNFTEDHTEGDVNGAAMIINAGMTVNYIYKRDLTLKTGFRYLFSFWIYVVAKSSQFSMEAVNSTTGKTYIYTGPMLTDEGKWIKYDLNFSVPISANKTTNDVTIGLQNMYKLISGNDYYIDDILVSTLHTDPLTINVTNNTPVCEGSNIQLVVNSTGDALPFTYSWTGPNGFISDESNPILSNSTPKMSGIYSVTVTDALGQVATATTNVVVNAVPDCNFTASANTIDSRHNTLTFSIQQQNGVQYKWDLGDGTTETGNFIQHTYDISQSSFDYKITLTAQNSIGCTNVASKTIDVVLFVPNVFTPNGDNKNDEFMKGYDIQIIDRYGLVIYKGIDGWDGTYNGKTMDNDTYFYILNYFDKNKQPKSQKGFVTLKK